MKVFVILSLALVSCGAVPTKNGMNMAPMMNGKHKTHMGGMPMTMSMSMGMKNKRESTDDLLKFIPADIAEGLPELLGKPSVPETKPVTEEKPTTTPMPEIKPEPEVKPTTTTSAPPKEEVPEIKSNMAPGKNNTPTTAEPEKITPTPEPHHTRMTNEPSNLSSEPIPSSDGKKSEAVDKTPIPISVSEVIKSKPLTNAHSHHSEKSENFEEEDDHDEKDCDDKDHHHKKSHKTSPHKKIEHEKKKMADNNNPEGLPEFELESSSPPTPVNPHRVEATHHKVRSAESIPPVDNKAVTQTQQEEADKALRDQFVGSRVERSHDHQKHQSHHKSSHDSHHQGDHSRHGMMDHGHNNKGHHMHRRSATRSSSSDYAASTPTRSSSGYGSTRTVVRESYSAPATRTVTRSSGYSSGTRSRSATRSSSGYGRAVRAEMGYGYSSPALDEVDGVVEEYHEAPVAPTVVRTVTTTYDEVVPAVREVEEYSAPAVREVEEYSAPVVSVRKSPLKFAVRHRAIVTKSSGYEEPAPAVRATSYEEQPTRIVSRTVPVVRESTGYSAPIRISADRYKRSADGTGMVTSMGGSKVSHFPNNKMSNNKMMKRMPMTML